MSTRFLRSAALVALAAFSSFAFADEETPTRVGRVSLAQGEVNISAEQGEEAEAAVVNWPVTSRNQVTTGRDGRTEIRIGSTAIRLDADSALDVAELEDDVLRLHLHYGSANILVRNADALRGFELSTPEGVVRLQETGRMRVDAGRRQDTTSVSVFDGVASVDGGGSRLIVRAGKRAEITRDDVRTGLAMRDSFDEWAMLRDLRDERSESVRYVTSEMTGYEELDQHGSWRQDSDYGPVWYPRSVSTDWVPYRDGRWTYLYPWGWTWVDNAPWGYAPSHYGRWVMVGNRWCWSPGRNVTRVVWSPALVGWVGGNNWNVSFNHGGSRRAAPATGWYPLSPRDVYTPTYRINHDKLRYINRGNGERRDDIRGGRRDDRQRHGLTVVPHEQFNRRGSFAVTNAPRAVVSTSLLLTAPSMVPPVPQGVVRGRDGRADNRAELRGENRGGGRNDNRGNGRNDDRVDNRGFDRNGDGRPDNRGQNGGAGFQGGGAPRPSVIVANPQPQPRPQPQQPGNTAFPRSQNDPLRQGQSSNMPTPAPALPPALQTPRQNPQQAPADDRAREERQRYERTIDADRERRRSAEIFQQQQQLQQQQQQMQQRQQQQQQFQRQEPRQEQPQRMAPAPQQQPQQQRMAPPSMPPPQVQQSQPQPQPQQQVSRPAPPPPQASGKGNEGVRRAREDANDRR